MTGCSRMRGTLFSLTCPLPLLVLLFSFLTSNFSPMPNLKCGTFTSSWWLPGFPGCYIAIVLFFLPLLFKNINFTSLHFLNSNGIALELPFESISKSFCERESHNYTNLRKDPHFPQPHHSHNPFLLSCFYMLAYWIKHLLFV